MKGRSCTVGVFLFLYKKLPANAAAEKTRELSAVSAPGASQSSFPVFFLFSLFARQLTL